MPFSRHRDYLDQHWNRPKRVWPQTASPQKKNTKHSPCFLGGGSAFSTAVVFTMVTLDARHKKRALRVSTRTLTCVPQKTGVLFTGGGGGGSERLFGKMPKEAPIAGSVKKLQNMGS